MGITQDWQDFHNHWDDSEGRVPGCKARVSQPGEWCPLASERIKTIPKKDWPDLIGSSDYKGLWSSVPLIYDQNSVGSCAAEGSVGSVTTLRSFTGCSLVKLSPWFVYHTTSGGRDGGSGVDENLRFIRDHGVASDKVWPRSKGWRKSPSDEAIEDAKNYKILEFFDIQTEEEFGSALLQGFDVTFARRGHCIYAIDLVSTTKIRYVNSWGNWGDKGTAVESLGGVNFGYGAWAVRVVTDTRQPLIVPASELVLPRFEPCPEIVED